MARLAHGAGEPGKQTRSRTRPNIIFMMTDDQAQSAMSAYGSTLLKTPNIDRIGVEGVRFNEAFVTNSLCAPSRASYLTGLYSHTHAVTTNGEEPGWYDQQGLRADQATWPKLLRDAGYQTAIVGKWHIKSAPQGFDHVAILPGQGEYFDPEFIVNDGHVRFRGHTDDVIADQALVWLKHRARNRPFCLLCQFKAPHSPWEPAKRFEDEFTNAQIPIPPAFDRLPNDMPEAVRKTQMSVAQMDFRSRGVPWSVPPDERALGNLQAFVQKLLSCVTRRRRERWSGSGLRR